MDLKVLHESFSVCKIPDISMVNLQDEYVFLGKTDEEFSLVCNTKVIPCNFIEKEDSWKAFKIQGQLDFSLIGILSKISKVLADKKIGIFVISTFNTDYILVKEDKLSLAIHALSKAGYGIV